MRFGIFLPPFHDFADPRAVVELASSAESAGWDGIFLWDHMLSEPGFAVADAWITMAAIASKTEVLRIGAMVTPLARRRPWVLARQIASLDHLSSGRLIVGVGLGDDGWREFSSFGEKVNPKDRATQLDEALELLQLFATGEAVDFNGVEYQVHAPPFLPRPLQRPVPIWVAGRWPNRRPMERASRYQGFFPIFAAPEPLAMPELDDIEAITQHLPPTGPVYDLVVRYAMSSANEPIEEAARLAEAGVTWILENFGAFGPDFETIREIVAAGPAGRA
ncbi:LLM class flavin-dependent oxidoreductase [Ferrimicrobium acidiphilum]|jgi:alkanesulfonate monooxygenase SsuD/methylene tetrahydromethanopterin reductase-like flavin-dependent oxidoreductase (luciferase family)|uniref:Methanesulfonate monooxygenase n=1 Tax=Ferrimicrobium acidiphilum DSM 19497 TaxID=1121877 RepID=A0A0D8FYE5_9ACTN|nr:LLM class flavin-dependent oxidoreductase [Ferrimicrobium acidiphilum]KJE78029.1 methanesulfonate monooxygenase [Ferrimicrobium acidiphilum DSM 19497]MCL5053222.1 LLM class flavin-dependent oxidoreductase [Gammaproteobacteria bacterium]